MIQIEGRTRNYDQWETPRGIDLDIPQGEFFAFLGPNAAGQNYHDQNARRTAQTHFGRSIFGGFDGKVFLELVEE